MFTPPSVETTNDTRLVCAVDQRREVELLVDVRAVLEIEAVDLLAGRAGLHGDQRLAEHLLGEGLHLLDRAGEPDAALVARGRLLEPALAAAARMDLALDDPERPAEFLAASAASAGVKAGKPLATGAPKARSTAFA